MIAKRREPKTARIQGAQIQEDRLEPSTSRSSQRETNGWWSWGCFLILLLPLFAYSNALKAPFLFDDFGSLVDNTSIRKLSDPARILRTMGRGSTVQGRPLLNLSLAVNYAIHGLSPAGFRAVNIALHAGNAILLFLLIRETLRFGNGCGPLREDATNVALAAAAIWIAHPMNTESVTYIIQRAESQAAFFWFLTLTSFVFWLRVGKGWLLALAIVSSLAGMASKEVAITAPFAALIYDRTFHAKSWREVFFRRWAAHAGVWATALLLLFILATDSGSRGGTAGFGLGVSSWHYFLTSIDAVATYLKLAFWPSPLILDYGRDVVTDLRTILPQAAIVFTVALAGLAYGWRQPWIGFLTLVFAATLAPASSFIPVVTQTRAEHRMYLPLAALVAFVVVSAAVLTRDWKSFWTKLALVTGIVAALSVATMVRNHDYRDEATIWLDTATKRPQNENAKFMVAYAKRLTPGVSGDEADQLVLESVTAVAAAHPESAQLQSRLGSVLYVYGEVEDSLRAYSKAIELDPTRWDDRSQMAELYMQKNDHDRALLEMDAAIRLCPYVNGNLLGQKGNLLQRMGRHRDAVEILNKAIALDPREVRTVSNRAKSLFELGRSTEALVDFEQCIALEPDEASHYDHLATALVNLSKPREALPHANRAVELSPDDPWYRYRRGLLLMSFDRYSLALDDFSQALAADENFSPAYEGRANVRFALGDFPAALRDWDRLVALGGVAPAELVEQAKARMQAESRAP